VASEVVLVFAASGLDAEDFLTEADFAFGLTTALGALDFTTFDTLGADF
jgi:hypothetical protein